MQESHQILTECLNTVKDPNNRNGSKVPEPCEGLQVPVRAGDGGECTTFYCPQENCQITCMRLVPEPNLALIKTVVKPIKNTVSEPSTAAAAALPVCRVELLRHHS